MQAIFDIINKPLGWLMAVFYNLLGNYGFAIIIVTILIKAVTIPFSIKSQKSMASINAIKPKEEEIRKKYANDKQKQQEEILKLYQEENINPMGGCLPNILPLIVLLAFYNVMRQPLTYMYGFSKDILTKVNELLHLSYPVAQIQNYELNIAQKMYEVFKTAPHTLDSLHLGTNAAGVNFDFFGLNLGLQPNFHQFNILWIWPVLATVTTFMMSYFSMRLQPGGLDKNNPSYGMMKNMMLFMPVMTAWFSFNMPSALAMYWVLSNILGIGQSYLMFKLFPAKPVEEVHESAKQKKERIRKAISESRKSSDDDE